MTEAPRGAAAEPVSTLAGGRATEARAAVGMAAAAAVSRTFGSLRMVVVAAVLGTTFLGNTFQSANSVSNVLYELLAAGALSAVLVPTFVELLSTGSQRDAEEVAGGVLGIVLLGLGVVTVLGVAFAPQLAVVLTAGVDDPAIAAQQRELATFLLRFFVPQILLYAVGAVATGVLNARGSFALATAAPIANTVVIVAAMLLFRRYAGEEPGLELPTSARLCLALGGTLGVAVFVGVPAVALRASGFRLRMGLRRAAGDLRVRRLLRLAGWATVQHAGAGVLLGAALVSAGGVAGGVVAYQLAMVVFLAPYGILAQPIHTAVLPRLATEAGKADRSELAASARWALLSMAKVTLPVAAGLVALALPIMQLLAFGEAASVESTRLLAAALAGLAVGVPAYGGFLLLARVFYAVGDSRTPAVAGLVTALAGGVAMVAAGSIDDEPWRLGAIGLAHSLAYLLGSVWLAWRLRPVVGSVATGAVARPLAASVAVGLAAWLAVEAWSPAGRTTTLAAVAAVGAAGAVAYVLAMGGRRGSRA